MPVIYNTPAGWFAWGAALGMIVMALVSELFGDLRVVDAPHLTIPALILICGFVFGMVHLVRKVGR